MPTINFCQAQASALPIYRKSSKEKYNQSIKDHVDKLTIKIQGFK